MRLLIAGATGLIGHHAADLALADTRFASVTLLVRRPVADWAATPAQILQVDYAALPALPQVDTVICALGTTMRKAGSRAAFRQVDYDYPVALAKAALAAGARHFLLVTAMGASAHSLVFYNRVKGEVEATIKAMPFPALTIARPSLLLGERQEFRLGELLFQPLAPLVPAPWRPIAGRTVAKALLELAIADRPGIAVIETAALARLGQ